ncbi:hypothetical protein Tco_1223619, partial [Tanacetum coccineum]
FPVCLANLNDLLNSNKQLPLIFQALSASLCKRSLHEDSFNETCEVTTLSSQALNFFSSDTKDLGLLETMLELHDLSDSFELKVWYFVYVERQEFPFCFPKQCYFSRNSSSDQCDIDAHLLKYIFVSTSHQQFSLALPH